MADSPLRFVEELFNPLEPFLDRIFLAGVVYGGWNAVRCCYCVLRSFRNYLLPIGATPVTTERLGEWAVVTGATTGLGKAFALNLAERNFKVVLVGNSDSKLQSIVKEIEDVFGTEAFGIYADFTKGPRVFEEIKELLIGFEIGVLVNNVAVCYDYPKWFEELSTQRMLHLLNVDVIGTTMMTHLLLPQMLKRQKGMIINVCASIASAPPTPLMTVYQAAMSYVNSFTQGLHYECTGRGVVAQVFLPSLIQRGTEETSVIAVQPRVYAQRALNSVGLSPSSYGHWIHAMQMWFLQQFVPNSLWTWWTRRANINLRSRGMEEKLERRTALLNILKHSRDGSFERNGDEDGRPRSRSAAFMSPVFPQSPVMDRRRSHSFQSGNLIISTK